jgi:DNA-binding MarR family transcriptional regulator
MEILSYAGSITVPEIGRVKSVSRQHIQLVVNTLLEMNLIKRQNNPNDKRTYLVSLTSLGRDTYDAIQIREMTELQTLCDEFDSEELRVATKMMQKLNKLLKNIN